MGTHFKNISVAFLVWLLGNGAWTVAVLILAMHVDNNTVIAIIGAIGFLSLILTGVIGAGWYLLKERGNPLQSSPQLENMARWVTAMYFAQRHKIEPDKLLELDSPQAMEERARRMEIEAKLETTESNEN
jgi:hypothetical protein